MRKQKKQRPQQKNRKARKKEKPAVSASPRPAPLPPAVQQTLNNAVQHHQAGLLQEAETFYRQVLQAVPNQPVALHLIGVIAFQQGQHEIAADYIRKALAVQPDYVDAHCNLGNALKKLGHLEDAAESYRKALKMKPNFPEALNNLGATLNALIKPEEARNCFHRALNLKPDYADAWNNLKFVTRALQVFHLNEGKAVEDPIVELTPTARETVDYAVLKFYLAKFQPHEADPAFNEILERLPAKSRQTVPVAARQPEDDAPISTMADKTVALLRFGRSGTGLIHSLIDGHPEISTLPSVYLRGYFNEGVWETLSAGGWQALPARFADVYDVLFDARSPKPIPSRIGEPSHSIGREEGMTTVGENRNEYLSVDKDVFCQAALRLMSGLQNVDPISFLQVVHAAVDEATGAKSSETKNKRLCFYHLHNPNDFACANYLRYAPDSRLLMMVREPLQNCESTLRLQFQANNYEECVHRLLGVLFDIDQILLRRLEAVGVRLEDVKARPESTMQALAAWLGVENSPTLYEMTAQGKKWWGDPSSPNYAADKAMTPFDATPTKRHVGAIFGERDQFVLATLFYPFSVRFGYREPDAEKFRKDLQDIRPLLGRLLLFEETMAENMGINREDLEKSVPSKLLHAGLLERWKVLDEMGEYPHMLEPLPISA